MEQRHRDIITKNMERLAYDTSDVGLEMLVDYLVRDGVFTADMTQPYLDQNETPVMRKTRFFLDIQTRGPTAFDKLVSALNEAGATDLAMLLKPPPQRVNRFQARPLGAIPSNLPNYIMESASGDLSQNLQTLALVYPNAMVNLNTEPLAVNVKRAVERLDLKHGAGAKLPHYRVGSRPKGLALIINIREFQQNVMPLRRGAELDGPNVKALFDALDYDTQDYYSDLTSAQLKEAVRKFAARREHVRVDSCMVCIMSHGTMVDSNTDLSTVIYASDGIPIKYIDILEKFNSENCPALIDKPKVFFFQACRGSERNHGVRMVGNVRRTETDGFGNMPKRNLSDILVAHSTPRGYEAIRDTFTGSWFISTLVKVFMENACDTEVVDMLDMVDNQMRCLVSEDNGLQTTCIEKIGFGKKFFLSPGLYDHPEAVPLEP